MKLLILNLGLILNLISNGQSLGVKTEGIEFPDSVLLDNQTLKLNGLGLRKATVFKVKVYAAALYLNEVAKDPDKILSSKEPKTLMMKFFRDVSKEQINEAWDKAFESNSSQFKVELSQLKAIMPNAKEGDLFEYLFSKDKTEFKLNRITRGSMPGGNWGKALLSTWIGKNPPTEELKKGLLNIADE